jgi:hypothetical protein
LRLVAFRNRGTGIVSSSPLFENLEAKPPGNALPQIHIKPPHACIPLGDEAYPLNSYLMKSHSRRNLSI